VVEPYVVDLEEIDKTQLALARGKAAHVGELLHIDGIRVPARICVTTIAFRRFMASVPGIGERTGQDREAPASKITVLAIHTRRTVVLGRDARCP
jgi:pyruvate,water dikinase